MRTTTVLIAIFLIALSVSGAPLLQGPGGEVIARPPNPPVHSVIIPSPRRADRNAVASRRAAQIETIIDAANKAREIKAYEQARSLYQSVLKLKAREARAYFGIGNTFFDQGRWQEAADAYNQATALQPRFADAYWSLGSIYHFYLHRYSDAVAAYRKYVELKPDDVRGLWFLGDSYLEAGQYTEAIVTYRRLLEMNPPQFESQEAHLGLGKSYIETGQYDLAVATLEEGIRLDPSGVAVKSSYFQIGLAYYEQGRYRQAITAFDEAKYLYYPTPYYYLGLTYLRMNNRAAANEQYQTLRYIQNENHIPHAGELADKLLAEINKQ